MTPEIQTAVQWVVLASTALFLLGVLAELRRVRLTRHQSVLVSGFRRYNLHSVTGAVIGSTKLSSSDTTVGGSNATFRAAVQRTSSTSSSLPMRMAKRAFN